MRHYNIFCKKRPPGNLIVHSLTFRLKNSAKHYIVLRAEDVGAVTIERTINDYPLSEDVFLTADDVGAVPTIRKINGKALSSDITLAASDVGAVTQAELDAAIKAAVLDSWVTEV